MLDRVKFNKNLAILFSARNQVPDANIYSIWYELLKHFSDEQVFPAIQKLVYSKEYPSVGAIVELITGGNSAEAENAWREVIESARQSGQLSISARSAKALNSFGGMQWLRDSNRDDANWHRKTFLEIYANTPDPFDTDFHCNGLQAKMYLKNNSQQIESHGSSFLE